MKLISVSALFVGLAAFTMTTTALGDEVVPMVASPPGSPKSEAKKEEEKKKEAEEPEVVAAPRPPANPREFKFSLKDGSIIAVEMTIEQVVVDTSFGKLTVPVSKIVSFTPGLDSRPELLKQIHDLIEALGDDDYKTREAAHKDLLKQADLVRQELIARSNDENAERKRHIAEILKEIEKRADERSGDEDAGESASTQNTWIRGDTIVTTEFTIVGKITNSSFDLKSKYGALTVKLADIARGQKDSENRSEIRRTVSVDGTNLAQMSWKSSGIRVEKGDRISIRADGSIIMSPWGETPSSPDGGANFGWYVNNQIPGGALIARIGTSGKVVKVGANKTYVAESSGALQFAVAMQHQYARQGYNFPGQYNIKVRVGGAATAE